jgi:hypothetical protein
MSAFNIVRMRVKPGFEEEYLSFHRERDISELKGLRALRVVRTGDRDFCFLGEWSDMDALTSARPQMIAILDRFRDKLEDLGGGLGVTDPVSGEAVIERLS